MHIFQIDSIVTAILNTRNIEENLILENIYTKLAELLPCSIRKWKYGDGKKIVVEIIADSDCTTLKS